jgi:hypothetical protein
MNLVLNFFSHTKKDNTIEAKMRIGVEMITSDDLISQKNIIIKRLMLLEESNR